MTQEEKNGALVIRVEGSINTMTSLEFKDALLEALSANQQVVVDMEQTDMVSSSGLRVILLGVKTATSQQKQLMFKNFNEDIKEVFDMTGVGEFLTVN
ncbi:MAG: STAS domain-containing protein [Christensenella sp.]